MWAESCRSGCRDAVVLGCLVAVPLLTWGCDPIAGTEGDSCASTQECAPGYRCVIVEGEATGKCSKGGGLEVFEHVLVRDRAPADGSHPGSDLLSVELSKPDQAIWPCDVVDSQVAPGEDLTSSFEFGACDEQSTTSLGGPGGFVEVTFDCGAGTRIEPGDVIYVNCCDLEGDESLEDDIVVSLVTEDDQVWEEACTSTLNEGTGFMGFCRIEVP